MLVCLLLGITLLIVLCKHGMILLQLLLPLMHNTWMRRILNLLLLLLIDVLWSSNIYIMPMHLLLLPSLLQVKSALSFWHLG